MVWGWRVRRAWTTSRALWLFQSGVNQSNKKKKTEETIFAQIHTPHINTALSILLFFPGKPAQKILFFALINKQTSSGCETDADYAMIP
jgi:hypothetical protein